MMRLGANIGFELRSLPGDAVAAWWASEVGHD